MGLTSKISFHSGGNWQIRNGPSTIRFTPTKLYSREWLQAVSLQWFLSSETFHPRPKGPESVQLIEVPEDKKLVVTLLVSLGNSNPDAPAAGDGKLLWQERLKDGRTILIQQTAVSETEADRAFALRVRQNTTITITNPAIADDFYAEATEIYSDKVSGNVLAMVPLGLDSLRFQGSEKKPPVK